MSDAAEIFTQRNGSIILYDNEDKLIDKNSTQKSGHFPKLVFEELESTPSKFGISLTKIARAKYTLTPGTVFTTQMTRLKNDDPQKEVTEIINIHGTFNSAFLAAGNDDKGMQDVCVSFSIQKINDIKVTQPDANNFFYRSMVENRDVLISREDSHIGRATFDINSSSIIIADLCIHRNPSIAGVKVDFEFCFKLEVLNP